MDGGVMGLQWDLMIGPSTGDYKMEMTGKPISPQLSNARSSTRNRKLVDFSIKSVLSCRFSLKFIHEKSWEHPRKTWLQHVAAGTGRNGTRPRPAPNFGEFENKKMLGVFSMWKIQCHKSTMTWDSWTKPCFLSLRMVDVYGFGGPMNVMNHTGWPQSNPPRHSLW